MIIAYMQLPLNFGFALGTDLTKALNFALPLSFPLVLHYVRAGWQQLSSRFGYHLVNFEDAPSLKHALAVSGIRNRGTIHE